MIYSNNPHRAKHRVSLALLFVLVGGVCFGQAVVNENNDPNQKSTLQKVDKLNCATENFVEREPTPEEVAIGNMNVDAMPARIQLNSGEEKKKNSKIKEEDNLTKPK